MLNQKILHYLTARPSKPPYGLGTVKAAYEQLGSPLSSTDTILVAGTNGKGTTCGIMAMILAAMGKRVGIYSSPHLMSIAERCEISSVFVSEQDLVREAGQVEAALTKDLFEALSSFELLTLTSFSLMARHEVDVAVVEVGMGGELDATNILNPKVSVVTAIGLDHLSELGGSLKGIAQAKAGIRRQGMPLVVAEAAAYGELREFWQGLHHRPIYMGSSEQAKTEELVWLPCHDGYQVPTIITHNHQLACEALRHLLGDDEFVIPPMPSWFRHRCPSVLWGRGQWMGARGNYYVDTAHNPQALQLSLAEFHASLRRRQGEGAKAVALMSVLSDKRPHELIGIAKSYAVKVFLFGGHERCYEAPSEEGLAYFYRWDIAFQRCHEFASNHDIGAIYIGGSFFAVQSWMKSQKALCERGRFHDFA